MTKIYFVLIQVLCSVFTKLLLLTSCHKHYESTSKSCLCKRNSHVGTYSKKTFKSEKKKNMKKVLLLLLILFIKKSAGFFISRLTFNESGGSRFLDKLRKVSGDNEIKSFKLNDRNDKSDLSEVLSNFRGEKSTEECPVKEEICEYDEEKQNIVCQKKCTTYRTSPEALCKKRMAKKCTPQCYRGKCVPYCYQIMKKLCRS